MLPIGGSVSQDTSLCQPSPLARGESLSAWMTISSGWFGACGAAGWMCKSPNIRPKARCCSWRQMLVAKEDDEVFCERPVDLVGGGVAQRLRQIDVADFGADDRRQFIDGDGFIRRRIVGDVFVAGPRNSLHACGHLDVSRSRRLPCGVSSSLAYFTGPSPRKQLLVRLGQFAHYDWSRSIVRPK